MIIELNNFGPIRTFLFDVNKDFHVVYGKNNIGKSYAISAVYIVLKAFLDGNRNIMSLFLFTNQSKFSKNELDLILNRVEERVGGTGADSMSIKTDYEKILKTFLEIKSGILSNIQEGLENSFALDNIHNLFSKEPMSISITFRTLSFSIRLNSDKNLEAYNVKINKKCTIKIAKTNRNIKASDDELRFYINEKELKTSMETLRSDIRTSAISVISYLFSEAKSIYNEVYFLPASRSGIYEAMNIFSSVMVRLSQLRHVVNRKIDIPALPVPTSDYFLNLSTIKLNKISDIYNGFASEIEDKILNAEILFDDETKKLEYLNKKINLKLDLSETSSMVSEIAPIVAHLKYIINEKREDNDVGSFFLGQDFENKKIEGKGSAKILFIEEPEAHLHPEVQIELLEIFSRMLKHDIKIVLTTHSNYIFNKVNNLLLKEEIPYKDAATYHLILKEKGSVLNSNSKPSDLGIVDENFVYSAEKLYNERLKIFKNE